MKIVLARAMPILVSVSVLDLVLVNTFNSSTWYLKASVTSIDAKTRHCMSIVHM